MLIDTADIAAALSVDRKYATDKIVKRADFPRPVLRLSQKVVKWRLEDFERWRRGQERAAARG